MNEKDGLKMQERENKETSEELCKGANSFNCRHGPHEFGKIRDILCYRCKTRMGCSNCVERPAEIICLYCHNWAMKKGVSKHGNIVPNAKVPRVNTDRGWINEHKLSGEVNKIIRGEI